MPCLAAQWHGKCGVDGEWTLGTSLGPEANGSRAVRQFDWKWIVDREEQSEVHVSRNEHAIGGLCMAAKSSNPHPAGTKIDMVLTVHSGDKGEFHSGRGRLREQIGRAGRGINGGRLALFGLSARRSLGFWEVAFVNQPKGRLLAVAGCCCCAANAKTSHPHPHPLPHPYLTLLDSQSPLQLQQQQHHHPIAPRRLEPFPLVPPSPPVNPSAGMLSQVSCCCR